MSAKKVRLSITDDKVRSLSYSRHDDGRQVEWDRKLVGFGLRVTPSGGKQYVLSYRFNGRPRLMSLGPIGHFRSIQEAAQRADDLLHQLRHRGIDPMTAREQLAESATLEELWKLYFAERLEHGNPNSRRSTSSLMKRHILPRLSDLKPAQITEADVVRMHDAATKKGRVVANRAVQRLADVLSWAHKRYPSSFPAGWQSPCKGVNRHREFARKHHLTAAQLGSLAQALEEERSPYIRTFVVLMILTGARKTELLSLRWEQVNLEAGAAVLSKTKSGEDVVQRLTPLAVRGLRELPVVAGSPFVFPGIKEGKPMADPRARYKLALKRAGLPPETTFHDLRRSFGTNLAHMGYSAEAIAAALHNTSQVAAKHYISIAGELVNEMATAHELAILPAPPAPEAPEHA